MEMSSQPHAPTAFPQRKAPRNILQKKLLWILRRIYPPFLCHPVPEKS